MTFMIHQVWVTLIHQIVKNIHNLIVSLLIIIGIILPVFSQTQELRENNFIIIYQLSDESMATEVVRLLRQTTPELEAFYGMPLRSLITIYLTPSLQEFRRVVPPTLPEWSHACFIPEQSTIILKKPGRFEEQGAIIHTLGHELSHVWLHHKLGAIPVPLWFHEGLAEYHSRKMIDTHAGMLIANALFAGKLVELTDIDSLPFFGTGRATIAYLEAYSAVQYLEKLLEEKGVSWSAYFNLIRENGFENALISALGMDLIDFHWQWYRWLQEKYRWFIIFNWENLIWVVMIVILLGALYAIRYRNRRRLLLWEAEESRTDSEIMSPESPHIHFK